ncbi:MAG: hypothetical protein V4473_02190 [Patescibacteria group bacterium]
MSVNLYLNNKVRELEGFKSERYSDNSGDKITFNGVQVFGEKGRLYLMWSEDSPVPDELKDLVEEISCYETIPQMGRRESGIYRHESAKCELTPEDYGNAKREKPMYKLKIIATKLEDIKAILHKVKTGAIRPEESYEGPQSGKSRRELENDSVHLEQTLELLRSATAEQARLMRTFDAVAVQHDQLLNKFTSLDIEAGRLTRELEERTREREGACAMVAELQDGLKLSEATFHMHQQDFTNACKKYVRMRQLARGLENQFLLPWISRSKVAKQIDAILDDTK